jgi:TRAP-type mannitol/chloroaromatic compound transport system permease small subunit
MRNTFSFIVKKIEWISLWSGKILSLLVLAMVGIILCEVVMRYFFNSPTNWAMESATMIFGVYMMGGGVYSLLVGGHVKMDILYDRWSKRKKAIVDILTFPLYLLFFSILLYLSTKYGLESLSMKEHSTTAWGPPIYPWKMLVPVIVLLMLGQGLANFIRNMFLAITGEEL